MLFYVKTSYYDEPPIVDTFDNKEEAGECYQATVDQRRDYGAHCGDIAQISTGIQYADGHRAIKASVSFE
jgi:hypothetical protein